jgi:hypothetical protein
MQKITFLLGVLVIVSACNNRKNLRSSDESDAVAESVQVDELLSNPASWVEKPVSVEGLVTHVCVHSGKRLHLKAGNSNKFIRVEAKGDIRQFERELEGSRLVINGTFHSRVIDEEYLAKWEKEIGAGPGAGHQIQDHGDAESELELLMEIKNQLQYSGEKQITQLWIDGESFSVKSNN